MLARALRPVFLFATSLIISVWAFPAEPASLWPSQSEYRLGKGLSLPGTGLTIGGYASAGFNSQTRQPWRFEVDDLSLFLTWENQGRWRLFSELEVEDALTYKEGGSPTTSETFFSVERLYADFIVSDALIVRFGKFLTPVGRWNLIHAAPLVWTTSRPLATERLFDKHSTGLMLHGSLPIFGKDLDYALYAEPTDELDPKSSHGGIAFNNAAGGRLLYHPGDNFEIGLSYLNFELQRKPSGRSNLVGTDFFWSRRQFEISGEFVYRRSGGPSPNDEAELYVQGVAPLGKGFFAVGRYEFVDSPGITAHFGIGGLAYRPFSPLVLKLEYRTGVHNRLLAPNGLFTSISVLF